MFPTTDVAIPQTPPARDVLGRWEPFFGQRSGESIEDFEKKQKKALPKINERRRNAEWWGVANQIMHNINVPVILGGGALLLADSFLDTRILPDNVREGIVKYSTWPLVLSLGAELGTKAISEFAFSPDKKLDDAVAQSLKLNRFGGKQLTAKIGKTGAWLAKWGLIGVAGVAAAEGLLGEGPVEGTIAQFFPNLPDVVPSMAYPAAALAVGSEIYRRNFKKQDEVYDAAMNFMKLSPDADKKSGEKKEYNTAKETLKKDSGKMAWAKLFTGDIAESIWWNIQKQKFDNEGLKGSGASVPLELTLKRTGFLENAITFLKRYQSFPIIGAGILGLASPYLNGAIPEAMYAFEQEHLNGVGPAIWAGLTLTGIAKHELIDKEGANWMDGFRTSAKKNIEGRPMFRAKNI